MTDIEIPYEKDRHARYRFFEILPGTISWSLLILPFVLSWLFVPAAVVFIIGYLLIYFVRSVGVDVRALQGYREMQRHQRLDWQQLLKEIEVGEIDNSLTIERPHWHAENLQRLQEQPVQIKPSQLIHVAIVATYNESREVLEPTIRTILGNDYDSKHIILLIAYEARGGERTEQLAKDLIKEYGKQFMHAAAVKHPNNIPGEVIGKGGNVTFAARFLQTYLARKHIDPLRVVVTTLDADNHPHRKYFGSLSYLYCVTPDPTYVSYQPVPVYTNNIWDVPAPMRVLATGNTLWNIVLTLRPHMLRNFSSHAQSMKTLIDTDFWSVRTIVEDGHQFWRTYFRYDGRHEVYPIYIPVYQDAVLSKSYAKTLKAQFIQLRRWTWGASDVAFVVDKGFFHKNKVPRRDLWVKLLRLMEGHVSWAVAPLLLAFSGFVPALLRPQSYAANILPLIISRVQDVALIGALASLFICFKTLPPKPERYKRHRSIFMLAQWVLLPVTSLVYSSTAALYSQTRLMFGKYIDKFDVTDKAVITDDNRTIL